MLWALEVRMKLTMVLLVFGAVGCSSSSSPGGPAPEYAAFIRGTLANAGNLGAAKAAHDQLAQGGESSARTAGDIAHAALLGTAILDSQQGDFLALDRWTDAASMEAFYANPKFAQAFAALF